MTTSFKLLLPQKVCLKWSKVETYGRLLTLECGNKLIARYKADNVMQLRSGDENIKINVDPDHKKR